MDSGRVEWIEELQYLIEEIFYHHHEIVLISILVEVKRTATYNVIYSTAERSCVVMMMV